MNDIDRCLLKITDDTLYVDKTTLLNLAPNDCRVEGYILSKSETILDTIKNISYSRSMKIILDKNLLYTEMNDDFKNYGVLFLVEGYRDFKKILDKEIESNEYAISNINELFSEEVLSLKKGIFKKYLWKKENITNWVIYNKIGLSVDLVNELSEDWIKFKNEVLIPDSDNFFISCNQDDKDIAILNFKKYSIDLIEKYKSDILNNVFNIWHQYIKVNIINPIIVEIYANQKYAAIYNKKYPKLAISYLSDKAFKEFALN